MLNDRDFALRIARRLRLKLAREPEVVKWQLPARDAEQLATILEVGVAAVTAPPAPIGPRTEMTELLRDNRLLETENKRLSRLLRAALYGATP